MGRAIDVEEEPAEEAVPCGLCGDPLVEGATGSLEPRGHLHRGCIRKARQEVLGQVGPHPFESGNGRRRKRRG